MDSGAADIFLDYTFAKENKILFVPKSRPLNIITLNGQPSGDGIVKFKTTTITLQVGVLHKEEVVFSLIPHFCPLSFVTHGYNNISLLLIGKMENLLGVVLSSKLSQPKRLFGCLLASVAIPPTFPHEYHEFADVFCKQEAEVLPPHRSFDCAINLIPGAPLPKGRTYPLSLPEQKSMKEFVTDNLERGYNLFQDSSRAHLTCKAGITTTERKPSLHED